MSFRIPRRDTEVRFVAKFSEIGCCKVAEKSSGLSHKKTRALRDSSQSPFFPKWADRTQNSLNVVTL